MELVEVHLEYLHLDIEETFDRLKLSSGESRGRGREIQIGLFLMNFLDSLVNWLVDGFIEIIGTLVLAAGIIPSGSYLLNV